METISFIENWNFYYIIIVIIRIIFNTKPAHTKQLKWKARKARKKKLNVLSDFCIKYYYMNDYQQ